MCLNTSGMCGILYHRKLNPEQIAFINATRFGLVWLTLRFHAGYSNSPDPLSSWTAGLFCFRWRNRVRLGTGRLESKRYPFRLREAPLCSIMSHLASYALQIGAWTSMRRAWLDLYVIHTYTWVMVTLHIRACACLSVFGLAWCPCLSPVLVVGTSCWGIQLGELEPSWDDSTTAYQDQRFAVETESEYR